MVVPSVGSGVGWGMIVPLMGVSVGGNAPSVDVDVEGRVCQSLWNTDCPPKCQQQCLTCQATAGEMREDLVKERLPGPLESGSWGFSSTGEELGAYRDRRAFPSLFMKEMSQPWCLWLESPNDTSQATILPWGTAMQELLGRGWKSGRKKNTIC